MLVAGIQRFLQCAYTACFRALHVYMQTVIGVFFVHGNACVSYMMMKFVLLGWMPSLNNRSKLKGECIDVKSRCGTSEGPTHYSQSLSLWSKALPQSRKHKAPLVVQWSRPLHPVQRFPSGEGSNFGRGRSWSDPNCPPKW